MGQAKNKNRQVGLSREDKKKMITAEILDAERNLLTSQMALAKAEEVEDLLKEGQESTLEDKKIDVIGWQRIVDRLRADFLDENPAIALVDSPDDSEEDLNEMPY